MLKIHAQLFRFQRLKIHMSILDLHIFLFLFTSWGIYSPTFQDTAIESQTQRTQLDLRNKSDLGMQKRLLLGH